MHRADYSFVCHPCAVVGQYQPLAARENTAQVCRDHRSKRYQSRGSSGVQGAQEVTGTRAGAAQVFGVRGIPVVGLETVARICNTSYTRAVFDVRGCWGCVCVCAGAFLSPHDS